MLGGMGARTREKYLMYMQARTWVPTVMVIESAPLLILKSVGARLGARFRCLFCTP